MNGWLATKMDVLLGHILSSLLFRPGEQSTTDLAVLQVYQQERFVAEPARFFDCPSASPSVTFGEVYARPAYICEPFTFPSTYRPLSDTFASRYASYPETQTVHGRRYRPYPWHAPQGRTRGGPPVTLVLLHGWTEGDYWWEERTLIPWLCRECGYTIVALVQPYHGARKPAGARFSGEFFISADLVRMVEACRQAVIDVRTALNWLLEEENGIVGIAGISLGAFMTYLLLCTDGRPAFAVPMLGHGDLLDGPGESSLTKHVYRGYQAQGLDPQTLSPQLRPLVAREMRSQLAPERILPINGLYDAIVTAEKSRRLFEAWEIPQVVWLPVGHFGIIHTRLFRRPLRDFVDRWCEL
jgi:pimeloyl-ACP methyl ester carboxylesterase